jgi:hypothetical protein
MKHIGGETGVAQKRGSFIMEVRSHCGNWDGISLFDKIILQIT